MKDPQLRAVSSASRGLWIDMLCLMWESARRGFLVHPTGRLVTTEQLARMTGNSVDDTTGMLNELEDCGVVSRNKDGILYSRRIERDERKRQKCVEAGKRGGNPALMGEDKGGVKSDAKGEVNQNPTPSSSPSSSSSISSSEERESAVAALPLADSPQAQKQKWTKRDMENATRLRDQILAIDPLYVHGAKDGTVALEKWADEFRLIRERDNRSQEDISFVLSHFPDDDFWSKNIRSPGALRGLTQTSRKDKFLTILASVKQSVRKNEQQHNDNRNGTPKTIPEQFRRPILDLDVGSRAAALRKIGLQPEDYDLNTLQRN